MSSRVLSTKGVALFAAVFAIFAFLASAAYGQDAGGMKGRVRTASGNGIPNATVTARQNGVDTKTVTATGKGDFVIDGLAPGRYNVVFDAKGYSSGVLYNIEVKKKKVSDLGDRLILSTDQGSLVIVKGSVFYKEGTSVTGAKVELEEVLSDGTTKKLANGYTNVSGEFTFRRPQGQSKLRVKATLKGVTGTKDIEVAEAAIYRLAISLDLSRSQDK